MFSSSFSYVQPPEPQAPGGAKTLGQLFQTAELRLREGLDELLRAIDAELDKGTRRVTIHLPYDKGGWLDSLYREAKVESVEYGETIEVEAVCSEKTVGQVREFITGGWQPPKEFWED